MALDAPFTDGSIYVLANQSCVGLVKIGMTGRDDVEIRVDEINRQAGTALPTPWEIVYTVKTTHYQEGEKRLHRYFDKYRVSRNREYFKISQDDAIAAINEMLGIQSAGDPSQVNADGLLPEDALLSNEADLISGSRALKQAFPNMSPRDRYQSLLEWYGETRLVKAKGVRLVASLFLSLFLGIGLAQLGRRIDSGLLIGVSVFLILAGPYLLYRFLPFYRSFPASLLQNLSGYRRQRAADSARKVREASDREALHRQAKDKAESIREARRAR